MSEADDYRGRHQSSHCSWPPDISFTVSTGTSYAFVVDGYVGRREIGDIGLARVPNGQPALLDLHADLGVIPAWLVTGTFVFSDARGKGYGSALYLAAFAEAVARSGGPVIIAASESFSGFGDDTSPDARYVWSRLLTRYPRSTHHLAIRFSPNDIEPWMLRRRENPAVRHPELQHRSHWESFLAQHPGRLDLVPEEPRKKNPVQNGVPGWVWFALAGGAALAAAALSSGGSSASSSPGPSPGPSSPPTPPGPNPFDDIFTPPEPVVPGPVPVPVPPGQLPPVPPPGTPPYQQNAPTSMGDAVVAAAQRDVGVTEVTENWSPRIREMLANTGWTSPAPWCAAAVTTWVFEGAKAIGRPSPIRGTASVPVLIQQLQDQNNPLVRWYDAAALQADPSLIQPGMIVCWSKAPKGAGAHTGIVETAPVGDDFRTIEGNSGAGSNACVEAFRHVSSVNLIGMGQLLDSPGNA